jgi:hypothetical protein
LAVPALPSAAAPGSASTRTRPRATVQPLTSLATRRTYRTLTSLGLTPDEAANLTAFMCGLPVEGVRWSLRQINELLFLRELRRTGRFGRSDGKAARPH